MTRRKKLSVRAALKKQRLRTGEYRIVVDDPRPHLERINNAQGRVTLSGIGKQADDPAVVQAKAELAEAQQAAQDCYVTAEFRAIPAPEYEALVQAHPPVKGVDDDTETVHDASFFPALLHVCQIAAGATGDDLLSAEEWAEHIATLPPGELKSLRAAVREVEFTAASEGLPKG